MEVQKKEMQMREVVVSSKTICDKCGEEIKTDSYDAFESEFNYKTGSSYPDGGYSENLELELCQKCGMVAVELLKSTGFNFQEIERDW
jgi:hypothetical protein